MKKQSLILQEKRGGVQDKIDAILDAVERSETRTATGDQLAEMRTLRTERDELDQQITGAQEVEAEALAREQRQAAERSFNIIGGHNKGGEAGEKRNIRKQFSFVKAIGAQMEGRRMDGVEAEVHQAGMDEAQAAKRSIECLAIPTFMIAPTTPEKRAQSVGTATQSGSLVETSIGEVIEYLYPRTVLTEMGATMWTGLSSNVDLIRQDGAASATWEGENDDNANTDPTVESVPLRPKRLGAQTIIGKQLIFQTNSVSVENWIRNNLNTAQGVALETAALNGSGVAPIPEGLLNISGIGDVAIGTNGGAPTWAKIVELESAVAAGNAEYGTLAYLTNPTMRGKLKVTEKASSTAQFIWEMNEMNGYRAFMSNVLPTNLVKGTSSDCIPILYGNWAELYIAQWDGLDIVVDPYTLAKKAQLAITVNGWYDVNIRHLQSFAAIQDARNV
jgi:HK97 family phage major capsid protein